MCLLHQNLGTHLKNQHSTFNMDIRITAELSEYIYLFYAVLQNSAYFLPKIVSKHLAHIQSLVLLVVLTIF